MTYWLGFTAVITSNYCSNSILLLQASVTALLLLLSTVAKELSNYYITVLFTAVITVDYCSKGILL